jgi:hypothetical protein
MIPILSPRLRPQVLSSSSEVRFCDISPTTAVQKLALPESQAKRNWKNPTEMLPQQSPDSSTPPQQGPSRGAPSHSGREFPTASSARPRVTQRTPLPSPPQRSPLGNSFFLRFPFPRLICGGARVLAFGGGLDHAGRVVAVDGGWGRAEDCRRWPLWKVTYFLEMHLPRKPSFYYWWSDLDCLNIVAK